MIQLLTHATKQKFPVLRLVRLAIFVLVIGVCLLQGTLIANEDALPPAELPLLNLLPPATTVTAQKAPLLLVHVGPPKTGTTSLQHAISMYEPHLLEDNYYYTGNSAFIDSFNVCTRRMVSNPNATHECWTNIFNTTEGHRNAGHNLILSNEVIALRAKDKVHFDLFRGLVDPWMPNVLVVVGYRHLHNFLHSTHYELQKNQRWPSNRERGKYVQSFVNFWQENHGRDLVGPMPTPATAIALFRAAQYNVSVLDIETKEQITEFFCDLLPHANHTCHHHQSLPLSVPTLNAKDSGRVNYDSLAILAFQRNMLKKSQTRSYLRARIKKFNEDVLHHGPDDFVLDCLDSGQEELFLQESISHARAAGFMNMDDAVRSDFAKAKETKKFCSINAWIVFHQKVWQDFFRGARKW
jgi:hypothetical protein